jgi:hypothetical protein
MCYSVRVANITDLCNEYGFEVDYDGTGKAVWTRIDESIVTAVCLRENGELQIAHNFDEEDRPMTIVSFSRYDEPAVRSILKEWVKPRETGKEEE